MGNSDNEVNSDNENSINDETLEDGFEGEDEEEDFSKDEGESEFDEDDNIYQNTHTHKSKSHTHLNSKKHKHKHKHKKNKKKSSRPHFVAIEASESSDNELSEAGSDLDLISNKPIKTNTPLPPGRDHFGDTLKKLFQRYDGPNTHEPEDIERNSLSDFEDPLDQNEDTELENLLPGVNDPKLWMVKLNKPGKEREVAIAIQNKFFKMQEIGKDLGITSCYAAQTLKGYIYVEAMSQFKVREALMGLRLINTTAEIKMVPLKEMVTIFTMGERDKYIPQISDYVRIKYGLYANDLGQIFSMQDQGSSVVVKLIPRIDFDLLIEMDKDGKKHVNQAKNNKNRPMKKLLDRDEVDAKGYRIEQGQPQRTIRLAGYTFDENGFIHKKFSINRLITGGNVNPTLSELKEFESAKLKDDDHIRSRIIRPTKQQLQLYKSGERIKIMTGDLTNLVCKILSVENDGLAVQPEDKSIQSFKIPFNHVCKVFSVGNCVRAISGLNNGDCGIVTGIDEDKKVATVFSITSHQQFDCTLDYLTLAPIEGYGMDGLQQIGNFYLGDLVSLTNEEVGVICFISRKNFVHILTDNDELLTSNASEISSKFSSFNQFGIDINRIPFRVKSRVQIMEGTHKGLVGVVQHMRKNAVFLKINDRIENGGYIAVPTQFCSVTGVTSSNTHTLNPRGNGINNTRGNMRTGRFKGGKSRNSLVGKQVKIINCKKHKGKIATIRDVDDDIIHVLIESSNISTRLPRSNIALWDNSEGLNSQLDQSGGSYLGRTFKQTTSKPTPPTPRTTWKPKPNTHIDQINTHTQSTQPFTHIDQLDTHTLPTPNSTHTQKIEFERSPSVDSMDMGENDELITKPLNILNYTHKPIWCVQGVLVDIIASGEFFNKIGIIEQHETDQNGSIICHVHVHKDVVGFYTQSLKPRLPEESKLDKCLVYIEGPNELARGLFIKQTDNQILVELENGQTVLASSVNVFHWIDLQAEFEGT